MNKEKLIHQLSELPLAQFEFFKTDELIFSERIRTVCEIECPRYSKSWACPPGVGTVEECREKCLSYPEGLLIVTLTEVSDIANMEETLSTRAPHEAITHQVADLVRAQGAKVYGLSTESCAVCENCTYPDAPCRHKEQMFPCVESHGIIVTDLAEKYGIEYLYGNQIVTWFSLILFKEE